jgi:hypothetical protein
VKEREENTSSKQRSKSELPTVSFVDEPQRRSVDEPQSPSTPPGVFTDAHKKSRLAEPTKGLFKTSNKPRETPNEPLRDPLKDKDAHQNVKISVFDAVSSSPVAQRQARDLSYLV